MDTFTAARAALLAHLKTHPELTDARVLAALATVERHLFVPHDLRSRAYEDTSLSIGLGQTISQPYVVGMMSQALRLSPSSRVLEIGTGSGYQTAVLARLCQHVVTLECVGTLAVRAAQLFQEQHIQGVVALIGDGSSGHAALGPYDGIILTAAADAVAPPLWNQLAVGGRLVAPLGGPELQQLHVFEKQADGTVTDQVLFGCRFVPLVGEFGRR